MNLNKFDDLMGPIYGQLNPEITVKYSLTPYSVDRFCCMFILPIIPCLGMGNSAATVSAHRPVRWKKTCNRTC